VTGSSSGNGRAIALALASEGAKVVCSDLKAQVATGGYENDQTPTHELIQQRGGNSVFQTTDVSSEVAVQELIAVAVKNYGRLDM
jgi:NAD(P)-dependent dehydrogenase (short-subunit alcohol dehydrogenase family)